MLTQDHMTGEEFSVSTETHLELTRVENDDECVGYVQINHKADFI